MTPDIFPSYTDNFRTFLLENKVFVSIVGLMLAGELKILTLSCIENLIEPFLSINIDLNNDNEHDLKTIYDYKFTFMGSTFKPGLVIRAIFRFLIILIVTFTISIFTRKLMLVDTNLKTK